MEYGTGAIFGCPAHDQRDLDFARKYGLPVIPVVLPGRRRPEDLRDRRHRGLYRRRHLFNSRFLDGSTSSGQEARLARSCGAGGDGEPARADGAVPPARLGRLAPALLGLPDPGHPLRACGVVPVPEDSCRWRCRTTSPSTSPATRWTTTRPGSTSTARPAARPARRETDTWTPSSIRPGTSPASPTRDAEDR
jgi:leucyl-tRNA synthetase